MSTAATPQGSQGHKLFQAATFSLRVEWDASRDPRCALVSTTISPLRGASKTHAITLSIPPNSQSARATFELQGASITLSLQLLSASSLVELHLEYPIDLDHFFSDAIAHWPDRAAPPAPTPDPRPISTNTQSDDLLFPFVAPQPRDPLRAIERALLFIEIDDPAALPLYNSLLSAHANPDPAAAIRAAASAYIATAGFISTPDALPAPLDVLPPMLDPLRALEADLDHAGLTLAIDLLLAGTPYADLDALFACPTFSTSRDSLWQSLIALSLVATPRQSPLADTLVATLRTLALLTITHAWSPDDPWLLETPIQRRELLDALPSLPLPTTLTPPAAPPDGWVNLLGVGALQHVRQRLLGYEPGDIAQIINVMSGERIELVQRTLDRDVTGEQTHLSHTRTDARTLDDHAQTSLEEELRGLIHVECLTRDLTDVTPSYGNLNMLLSGTAKDDGCDRERRDSSLTRYARDLTTRATERVASRVRSSRTRRSLHEQERRATSTLDNTAAPARAGIYRWLRKLVHVFIVEVGRRVFIEIMVPDPAAAYRQTLPLVEGVPLDKPTEIAPLVDADPAAITPENYLGFAATYELHDLPPPPANTLCHHAELGPGLPASLTLSAPDGYILSALDLASITSDAGAPVVGVAAGKTFSLTTTPQLAAPTLPATVTTSDPPTPCADCDQPIPAPTPTTPAAYTEHQDLSSNPARAVVVTAISQAPSWHLSATLTCALDPSGDALAAWQQRVYQRLLERYNALLRAWNAAIEAHIKRDAPRARAIERDALRAASQLALWAHTSPPADSQPSPAFLRFLQDALEWSEQTYAFAPWQPGDPAPPTLPSQWRGERAPGLPDPDATFRAFIQAGSARVLIPVAPGNAASLLHLLSFGSIWPGTRESAPICIADIPTILDLLPNEHSEPSTDPWLVAIPTDLLLLDSAAPDLTPT